MQPRTSPIPAEVFRAYDIRGIAGEQLSSTVVQLIGRALGSEALDQGIDALLLGYDGRLSSPDLAQALRAGIRSSGCAVVDLGLVPTPLLYFATHTSEYDSGVMLTASHNPPNYNGMKIVFGKSSLAEDQIQRLRERITTGALHSGSGSYQTLDMREAYLQDVAARITLSRPLRVVVDCSNAVPAVIAPELLRRLGCEVIALFCDLDGRFPNHPPDPTIAANLQQLGQRVRSANADVGLGFDGDGDRLGLVTEAGTAVPTDQLLMLLAKHVMPNYPGSPMVFDVKCSMQLAQLIRDLGCLPVMHNSGHSLMKQKMKETGAPLGGEYAAHFFIQDRWYGFDDGMYAAARLLEIISALPHGAEQEFSAFQSWFSTPELKLPMPDSEKFRFMEKLLSVAELPGARLITIDGLRVEYEDGWGLIRASNTSPAILLRFEARTAERLQEIQKQFKALIQKADNSIDPDF